MKYENQIFYMNQKEKIKSLHYIHCESISKFTTYFTTSPINNIESKLGIFDSYGPNSYWLEKKEK